MQRVFVIFLILHSTYFFAFGQKNNYEFSNDGPLRIAIGSCFRTELNDNTMWQYVTRSNPDLWIWLGDIVYADTKDMRVMQQQYNRLKTNSEYKKLQQRTDIIGIWDDHDYGQNDGGKYYSHKKQSKAQLLSFLDVDQSNEVFDHEGIYQSYVVNHNGHKVKILLLDTRYFRDTLYADTESEERYQINQSGDILGEKQWQWLESELSKNEGEVSRRLEV